ncbi:VENN motif pre-toxin domain-containing protein, partial [Buttiauxella sp. A2-C2_NF]|uniref:VENN motif pre-toxin domain-containing protein n=1 Tax=Buttiauxella ferragutiae TaxID=82989 RepID=UPI001E4BAEDA
VKPENMTGEQKQTLSVLGTLAAGLAGGLAGDSSANAVAGAQAGKNAVENNALSDDEEEIERTHGALDIKSLNFNPTAGGPVLDEHGHPTGAFTPPSGVPIGGKGSRPTAKQSEKDVGGELGNGWKEQVSYKDGEVVPYGTKGSTRPDWCNGSTCSVEVKNYNIEKNQSGLINNVVKQAITRQANIPPGMDQRVTIDIRGQNVTPEQERSIIRGIVQKSNGIIDPSAIEFKR